MANDPSVPRVVFDANVLISAIVYREKLIGRFGFSAAKAANAVGFFERISQFVPPIPRHTGVCRDPKDDHLLDRAVEGRVGTIITGDKDLLVLDPFESRAVRDAGVVRILPPAGFLAWLGHR